MLKEFIEARKAIKSGPLRKCYCFWGEEDFFKESLLKEVTKISKGFDILRFSNDLKVDEIQESLGDDDFFHRKRLIIISDFDQIDKKDKIIKLFSDSIPEDVVICILSEKEIKKVSDIENILVVECSKIKVYDVENLEKFISSIVKGTGYTIDQNASKFLINTCSNDLTSIVNELRKTFSIYPKDHLIAIEDLKRTVYIKPQENIFQLADFIASKNIIKCLELINDFETTDQSPIGLVRYLCENFKALCIILDMSKNNFDLKEISAYIKKPFFIVRNLEKDAKKLGLKKLLSFFRELCEIDLKQKSSDIDGFALLKSFLIKACKS